VIENNSLRFDQNKAACEAYATVLGSCHFPRILEIKKISQSLAVPDFGPTLANHDRGQAFRMESLQKCTQIIDPRCCSLVSHVSHVNMFDPDRAGSVFAFRLSDFRAGFDKLQFQFLLSPRPTTNSLESAQTFLEDISCSRKYLFCTRAKH
jgi:hypothetical protein